MKEYFLNHRIGFNEYITGNRFIDICEQTGATFCKTDYLNAFVDSTHKVFVTHNSDYHIDKDRFAIGPECKYWLAQNKSVKSDKLIPIPIGLENMTLRTSDMSQKGLFSSQVPGALQKATLIDKLNHYDVKKNKLVYMNFNLETSLNERTFVWNKFKNCDWVTVSGRKTMEQYYFDLASHKFVISPRGNGVDCHRVWEALYLRTIPIVKRTVQMKEFDDLPIYFVDNWSEVDYNKLNDFYKEVTKTKYNLNKLKISWWRQFINEKLSE